MYTCKMCRVIRVLIYFSVIYLVTVSSAKPKIVHSFIEHEIVPDVLVLPPEQLLIVKFANGVEALEGNELSPSKVNNVPFLEWNYEQDKFYTLIMCDADAPSRVNPEARCFLHWLVVNIPREDVDAGETLTSILHSHPEPLTGLHRYIFLIYTQHGYIDFEEQPSDEFERRKGFMPEYFSNKYGLGPPLAGNFYQTENFEDLIIKR